LFSELSYFGGFMISLTISGILLTVIESDDNGDRTESCRCKI